MDAQQIKEEQKNEIDALKSMYADQMKIVKRDPYEFSVALKSSEPEDPETGLQLSLTVRVKFTKTYPMESPEIIIKHKSGLVNKDCDELEQRFRETAEANLGSVFLFTLLSETQEWLEEKRIEKETEEKTAQEEREKSEEQKQLEMQMAEKERLIQDEKNSIISQTMDRFTKDIEVFGDKGGTTPVTIESFKIWKNAFQEALKSLQKGSTMKREDRFARFPGTMSGKDIWLTKSAAALGLEGDEQKNEIPEEENKIVQEEPCDEGAIDEDLFMDDEDDAEEKKLFD